MMSGMRTAATAFLAAILASSIAACGSSQVVRGPSSHPVRVSTPRYGASVVVHRGDTLYHLATSNGITALDLALWNGIRPPYTIYPGQRLRLYPASGVSARASAPPRPADRIAWSSTSSIVASTARNAMDAPPGATPSAASNSIRAMVVP